MPGRRLAPGPGGPAWGLLAWGLLAPTGSVQTSVRPWAAAVPGPALPLGKLA